jgi:hypothetical protein
MVPRGGLAWGELDEAQRAALIDLLGSVLSTEGLRIVREQMAADDVLAAEQEEGGGGERQLHFGSDYYYVSFLGAAASTSPWMLQFGGHHFAINATVVGPHVSLSPSLTVGQPLRFKLQGEEIDIVEEEVSEAAALMESFTEAQREAALVGSRRIDLVGLRRAAGVRHSAVLQGAIARL